MAKKSKKSGIKVYRGIKLRGTQFESKADFLKWKSKFGRKRKVGRIAVSGTIRSH